MRAMFGRLHRWAGLLTAAFLFFSGVTGAVISWDHEIDETLNAKLFDVTSSGPAIPSTELAKQIEQRDPRARVIFFPMTPEPGHSLAFFVQPRIRPPPSATRSTTTRSSSIPTPGPNSAGATGARYGR